MRVLVVLMLCRAVFAADSIRLRKTIYRGQSEILDFQNQIKRMAISDPEVADARVISPRQILVDGKADGSTSLIVWPDKGPYINYRLNVCSEVSDFQVMLKVHFMEINKNALKTLGSDFLIKSMKFGAQEIDIGSFGGKVGEPHDPLFLGNTVDMFFAWPTQNFSSIIKALHEDNLVNILAEPNLSTISGSEASFLAGGEFPVPIVTGSMGMQSISIQYKEFGVKLKFLPTVLDTSTVHMKVTAEVSSLDFENGIVMSGFEIPSLNTRRAETTVEIAQGKYFVIGGLLSNETAKKIAKIPVLGHLPILGKLFSSERYQKKETELLITLSPTIVQAVSEDDLPTLQMESD